MSLCRGTEKNSRIIAEQECVLSSGVRGGELMKAALQDSEHVTSPL